MLVESIPSLEEPSFWGTVPSEAAMEHLIESCALAVQYGQEKHSHHLKRTKGRKQKVKCILQGVGKP